MRTRNHSVSVWLNEKEYAYLQKQAAVCGLKLDPFIRSLILNTDLRPRPPDEYGGLLRELAAIGNNINQIARLANTQRSIDRERINAAALLVDEAWRLLKERL